MESRLEKRKRLKRQKRITFFKSLIIISIIIILSLGIKLVNDEIIYLGYIDNTTIFDLNVKEMKIQLFGKKYLIDLKILKEFPD